MDDFDSFASFRQGITNEEFLGYFLIVVIIGLIVYRVIDAKREDKYENRKH